MSDDLSLDPTVVEPVDPLVGTQMGRYSILSRIAKGGTATVYQALDNVLNREVAVKILHEHLEGKKEVIERFKKEAQVIAQLRHPNILTVFDFFEFKDRAVVVTEYMPGITLSHLIKNCPKVPEPYVFMIGLEILQGLRAAHEKGITHRDIKPANILMNSEHGVKISDFGLAKLVNIDDGLTKEGVFVGTPSFSSPEQIEGRPVDHRSDLFSLGLTLYMLATRSHAFKVKGDSTTTVWFKIVKGKFQAAREINPDLSPDLERILERSLEVDVKKRYQSAQEMIQDIESLLKARRQFPYQDKLRSFIKNPDTARTTGVVYRRQKKSIWTITATIPLLIGLGVSIWRLQEKNVDPAIPENPLVESLSRKGEAEKEKPSSSQRQEPELPKKISVHLIPSAIPIPKDILWISESRDPGPGLRIRWDGDGKFALAKDREFENPVESGIFPSHFYDAQGLEPAIYYWRGGSSEGRFIIETYNSYRARMKISKRPVVVSSQFGDVDLEINPWHQELRLSWQAGPDAVSYRLDVGTDSQLKNKIFSGTAATKFFTIERNWEKNQSLFWRVSYMDEQSNVFLIDPTRRINLKLKGSAPYFDILSPQPGDRIQNNTVEIRAIGPQMGRFSCRLIAKNKEAPAPVDIPRRGGGFFIGKVVHTETPRWLSCVGKEETKPPVYLSVVLGDE